MLCCGESLGPAHNLIQLFLSHHHQRIRANIVLKQLSLQKLKLPQLPCFNQPCAKRNQHLSLATFALELFGPLFQKIPFQKCRVLDLLLKHAARHICYTIQIAFNRAHL